MKNIFIAKPDVEELSENEWLVLRSKYAYSNTPYIEAMNCDGDFESITQNVPEIDLEEGEVVLDHNLYSCAKEFVSDIIEYIADSFREVTFGPFSTKTYVLKLKENWMELSLDMDV